MTLVPFRRVQSPAYNTGFESFDRLFDRMLGNALTNLSSPAPSVTDLTLRLDVGETEKSYVLTGDLPGIDEKDLDISVADGVLTIAGEKKQATEEKTRSFHRVERSYGSFRRALALPADADENGIAARLKNGVLEVEIAKLPQAQKNPRRIAVETN